MKLNSLLGYWIHGLRTIMKRSSLLELNSLAVYGADPFLQNTDQIYWIPTILSSVLSDLGFLFTRTFGFPYPISSFFLSFAFVALSSFIVSYFLVAGVATMEDTGLPIHKDGENEENLASLLVAGFATKKIMLLLGSFRPTLRKC